MHNWGIDQALRYVQEIEDAIAELADFPWIGRRQDDVFADARARIVGRHIVFYRVTEEMIEVLCIYDQRVELRCRSD